MSERDRPAIDAPGHAARQRLRAASLSLVVALVLFGVKLQAWRLTHSTAVLSDALESIVNIVAAGLALFSVWYGSRPADDEHPYGHGKVEDFSAGVEGALIILAAGGILWSAIPRFFDPAVLESLDRGAALVIVATLVNAGLGWYLVRQGRRYHSRALMADGKHVLTDVYSSAGALLGLLVVGTTGWLWVDPLLACLIAGHILVSGFGLIRGSVGRLMDESDEETLERLAEQLRVHRRPEWIDVHELRAWWAGDLLHADLHLALPRYWTIERGHGEGDALESALVREWGGRASVVVHVDPCRDVWCRHCRVEDCPIRAEAFVEELPFDRDHLVRFVPPLPNSPLSRVLRPAPPPTQNPAP